jgi:hypothetical protein
VLSDVGAPAAANDGDVALPRPHRRREISVVAIIFVLIALILLWTSTSDGYATHIGAVQTDQYNQLADGFLHGQLSILTPAPKGLTSLSDPYSPALNSAYQGAYHDLALYHGHFYLTWGPTPVITLYIPWRILHLGDMPVGFSVWIFCVIGLGFILAAFYRLATHYVPTVNTKRLALCSVALALSSVLPFILQRTEVYEAAISSAYCFVGIGAYFLVTGALSGRLSLRRLAISSLAFGLTAGGRWDLVFVGGFILPLVALHYVRNNRDLRSRLRGITWILGPFALCILLLLWYNVARFGSPLESGASYVLAGYDPTVAKLYQPGYLPPDLFYYLIDPPHFTLNFPYFQLPPAPYYPFAVPTGYLGAEITGGLIASTPILLWLAAAPFILRRSARSAFRPVVLLPVFVAIVVILFIAFTIPGATMRYEVDFATLLLVPALLVWLVTCEGRRPLRSISRVLGTIAIVLGCWVGMAAGLTGYEDFLPYTRPVQWSAMEYVTSPIPDAVIRIVGHPIVSWLASPDGQDVALGNFGFGIGTIERFYASPQATFINVMAPHAGTLRIQATLVTTGTGIVGQPSPVDIIVKNGRDQISKPEHAGHISLNIPVRGGLNPLQLSAKLPGKPEAPMAGLAAVWYLTVSER